VNDTIHMRRALNLAAAQLGRTGENPAVGCVIVAENEGVGEGATGDGGRPHAEECALGQAGARANGATAYVTLEPCARRSSGAVSCADLLIQAGIERVVIAAHDPHPYAAGVGIERMRAASLLVESGLLAAEARAQNASFFAALERPGK
jgi:pyrimidine deaminase RibD-like protein